MKHLPTRQSQVAGCLSIDGLFGLCVNFKGGGCFVGGVKFSMACLATRQYILQ